MAESPKLPVLDRSKLLRLFDNASTPTRAPERGGFSLKLQCSKTAESFRAHYRPVGNDFRLTRFEPIGSGMTAAAALPSDQSGRTVDVFSIGLERERCPVCKAPFLISCGKCTGLLCFGSTKDNFFRCPCGESGEIQGVSSLLHSADPAATGASADRSTSKPQITNQKTEPQRFLPKPKL